MIRLSARSTRLMLMAVCAAAISAAAASPGHAGVITQTDTFGPLSGGGTRFTTGGPFTFVTASPSFTQFDAGLGSLTSATLSWTITGSETGSGNFAGTGMFSYGGKSQTVTFDTVSDPGPKSFDFVDSDLLSAASVTGLGTFIPSVFTGTMSQSGFFPWAGSMSNVDGTVTLTYDFMSASAAIPEPAALALFGTALAMLGCALRRNRRKRRLA